MAGSKKGRISGAARKELNAQRGGTVVTAHLSKKGDVDTAIARVTKHVGINHVRVMLPGGRTPLELTARIPNIFTRKGATPITTRSIVAIFVGKEFDAETYTPSKGDMFDIVAILESKDISSLSRAGLVPDWMTRVEEATADAAARSAAGETLGYVMEDDDEDEGAEESTGAGGGAAAGFRRGAARMAAVSGGGAGGDSGSDFDIDDI